MKINKFLLRQTAMLKINWKLSRKFDEQDFDKIDQNYLDLTRISALFTAANFEF